MKSDKVSEHFLPFFMETAVIFPPKPPIFMSPSIAFRPAQPLLLRFTPAAFKLFAATCSAPASAVASTTTCEPEILTIPEPSIPKSPRSIGSTRSRARAKKVVLDAQQLKLNWLESLSCPRSENEGEDSGPDNAGSKWVIGVDPDIFGALAVLKPDNSAQVYDSPHLQVLVGKKVRKRLDVKSIIQLLQKVDAPIGTTVYIEQSIPYPQDGKQGWWSGGFGYGLWIGALVASGYSVVPVPSSLWKNGFKLTGSRSSKDDSRELATTLFPSTRSLLKRKKDHGRAEALLIAAYGKGLNIGYSSCILDDPVPCNQENVLEQFCGQLKSSL